MDESKYLPAVVTMKRGVTPELWIWRVRPAGELRFTPGQYVAMGLPSGGRMVERPYSISSAPGETELEFFIELVPGGALTPLLYDVPVGGPVYLRRAAKGRFVLDRAGGHRNHLMVASVTGAAPFVSMIRDAARREAAGEPAAHRVLMLQSASTPEELGYDEELTAAARAYSWFEYVPAISRAWLAPGWSGERGRAEDVVRKHSDGAGFTPENTTVYVCGNPQMIRNVQGVMERAGFPRKSLREEMYWQPAPAAC